MRIKEVTLGQMAKIWKEHYKKEAKKMGYSEQYIEEVISVGFDCVDDFVKQVSKLDYILIKDSDMPSRRRQKNTMEDKE